MQLTDAEKQRIGTIIKKTEQIKDKDPKYEVFGSGKWKYKWPKPASERELTVFEKKYDIILPREYRLFLGFVANGGPGFSYGIYPIEKTDVLGDIKKESTCFPFMTVEDFQAIDKLQQAIYEKDENSEEDIFYNGLLNIGTEGCTYEICLVVTGEHRGRLVRTDANEDGPFYFIHDANFLDWYERWLDDFIAGMDMGSFGDSIAGSQAELRRQFVEENNPSIKIAALSSLGRFPKTDTETVDLWVDVCKSEYPEDICYVALWQLIHKRVPTTQDIIALLFNASQEKRNACIKLLRFASKHGVNIEPFIPKLMEIMPKLSDLFPKAVYAIQETSFNKYETFLPFLDLPNNSMRLTALWALGNVPDRNNENFVRRITPFFDDEDIDLVRQAILSLMELQDDRVPPLVDKAYRRFPELEELRENYYRRTWK